MTTADQPNTPPRPYWDVVADVAAIAAEHDAEMARLERAEEGFETPTDEQLAADNARLAADNARLAADNARHDADNARHDAELSRRGVR